ncbi:uncharacterized protein [Periplaneta americana]|uniref:uncharacterized protein n=1 Tax=Periplaneta americana TaxID=6978 RepID=UPI0037E8E359
MKCSVMIFAGTVCVLLLIQCATSQICPQCMCRSSYSPVCARHSETNKLRGFANKCVFDCNNKCRNNKFVYLGSGRCGKYLTTTTSRPTTTTTTTIPTTPLPYLRAEK